MPAPEGGESRVFPEDSTARASTVAGVTVRKSVTPVVNRGQVDSSRLLARLLRSRLFLAGIGLLAMGTIPFLFSLVILQEAVSARGDHWTAQATVIARPSKGVVELGYLDRMRAPRTATLSVSRSTWEEWREGHTVPLMVSTSDPDVVWLEHESPPGIRTPFSLGVLGIGLWIVGVTLAVLAALRERTDRVAA